ncbi:MAG: hypothetical protein Q9215_008250 [Flavoplaca cf. flavocitrina]
MATANASNDREGRWPTAATYSDSSHCDDEQSYSDESAVSNSIDENIEPSSSGKRGNENILSSASAKKSRVTAPDKDTETSIRDDGPKLPRSASPASAEQYKTALFNIRHGTDTMKLVGLGQLDRILNSDTTLGKELRKDTGIILDLWKVIPKHYFDCLFSLLKFKCSNDRNRDWLAKQGLSSIHTFVKLVPESSKNHADFAERIDKLLDIIVVETYISADTKQLALAILNKLAATRNGSLALLSSKHWPVLIQSAVKYPIISSIDKKRVLPLVWSHTQRKRVSDAPAWLAPLTQRLLVSASFQHTDAIRNRDMVVFLAAALVQCYPEHSPALLFAERSSAMSSPSAKPAAWVFIQQRLIDIRSSIPSLMDSPGDGDELMSSRLAQCYHLVTAFIYSLAERSESMSEENDVELPYHPALLLRIREDMSNMCSLTMEYLSGRFEASEANKSIRRTPRGNKTVRFKSVHKDSLPKMAKDELVVHQLRMLSYWFQEDDSEVLRKEARSGLMKVCIGLYSEAGKHLRTFLSTIMEECWIPDEEGSS